MFEFNNPLEELDRTKLVEFVGIDDKLKGIEKVDISRIRLCIVG
ncbi:hypothetical protein AGMMS49531_10610 [Endomicrobiia bacterium]|nr:hypothetical protein AGMMS49531_10610 [Endomicrobiia bacterium]